MHITREKNVMRSQMLLLLILVGLLAAGRAQAQTWASPLVLAYTTYHQYSWDTCSDGNTIVDIDTFFSPGPDAVYRLNNIAVGRNPLHFGDTILTLTPLYYSPQLDFEVWVCASDNGPFASNCPIEADNIYNSQQPIHLYVPAAYKTYHIIVTSGNLGFGGACGPYTLDVQRVPQ